MKKNGKKVAVMLLLAVIAVGSYFVSGTYAKYTRALSGHDTATVAKFSVSAGDLAKTGAEISLFDTIKDDDITTAEGHVKAGLIAPGTGGEFTIALTNDSEVDVKAEIKISETANTSNVPIEYSTDKTTWKSAGDFTKEIECLDYKGKASGTSSENVTVYWRWAYEVKTGDNVDTAHDATDTGIGEIETGESVPTVTTNVTATFTQID